MTISPVQGCGKQLVQFISPFEFFNFHGSALNPEYTNLGGDGGNFVLVSFIGNPFSLNLNNMDPPHPNHEVVVAHCRLGKADMNDSTVRPITYRLQVDYIDTDGSTVIFTFGSQFRLGVISSVTEDFSLWAFIGFVHDEIDEAGTYRCDVIAWEKDDAGTFGPNSPFVTSFDITVTNADISSHERGAGSEGHLWIEGNNLHYIDGEQFEHSIAPEVSVSGAGSLGGEIFVDITDGASEKEARMAWAVGSTIKKSHQPQEQIGNIWPHGGHIWTGTTFFRQRGTLLFITQDPVTISNSRLLRVDDGSEGDGDFNGN